MIRDAEAVSRELDLACHGTLEAFWSRLDERVWRPLHTAVEDARGAHQKAMESAGLHGECPQAGGAAEERAAAYFMAAADSVHQPLWKALAACLPADRIGEAMEEARAQSHEACAGLPSQTEVEVGSLASMPYDGVGRRVGRRVARAVRAVSRAAPSRAVDVRAVALRHRSQKIEELEEAWSEGASRLWSVWLGTLESAAAEWAAVALSDLPADPGEAEGDRTRRWDALVAAAAALDEDLAALAAAHPHRELAEASREQISRCRAFLKSDLSVAGTFLLRTGSVQREATTRPRATAWKRWQAESVMRLQMYASLLAVWVGVARSRAEMLDRLRGEVLVTWRERAEEGAAALRAVAAALRKSRPQDQSGLDGARAEAEAVLTGVQDGCPTRSELQSVARRVAGMAVGSVQASLRSVPAKLDLHPLPSPGRPLREPPSVTRSIALEEMARQAFDTLRMERIRTAPTPLVVEAEGLASAVSEIADIVAFGFDAAASEMAGEDEKRCARALELAVEGLERAAESLTETSVPLEDALDALDARVGTEVMSGIDSLAGRALAHRVQGRLLDARTRVAGAFHGLRRWAGPGFERWVQAVRVRLLGLRRMASRGLGWTRSLLGAGASGPAAAVRTARSLARADDLVDALPLVYQHLFAGEPLSDPVLMAGRDVEVAEVEQRWRRWHEEEGIPLLVTGRTGSGVSSFFNVFVAKIGDGGARTLHRVLDRRITAEPELAAYLADLLGMEGGTSLDDLASVVLGAPAEALPDLVALEGLEHLYLRVPGGTDLLERLFTFMAETEPRMFWVGSITPTAWQVVEKSEPAVAAQLDQLELRALSAAEIQTAVLLRHRRSGLRIHYEEPVEGRRLLRRRVRRLRGTERHQQVLESDYFDRLHRTSLGNLRLAFFQWLRSVDFAGGESRLVVHPLAALDFSFLDSLNLTQNFTVKAFLEHSTLTLAEHDAIFRVPRQESYHVFESLGNRQVIEAVPRPDDGPAVSEVRSDIRYRIRLLLAGAVTGHLGSKNIVH